MDRMVTVSYEKLLALLELANQVPSDRAPEGEEPDVGGCD